MIPTPEVNGRVPPVVMLPARGSKIPLVFDSPHSGSHYPESFKTLVSLDRMRRAEDAFVDELFAAAPDHGAPLIAATFPRLFVDPNRAPEDFEPSEVQGAFAVPLQPSKKAAVGKGIVWTRLHGLASLYEAPLTATEVMRRIDAYWRPYHVAVASALDEAFDEFGRVYHVNCHSMRARGNPMDEDGESDRPDFVISDGDGGTSDPHFTKFVSDHLRDEGFTAPCNDPYKGADLVRRYSDPARGRHSIQIEINRKLYMNEERVEKAATFPAVKDVLTDLIRTIADYVRDDAG
tara:strand:+ start:704 stop:1576 length:873 start_codon:yes stop_codon:yes gene_type:complete